MTPNFTGLWRVDLARSNLLSPPVARILMKIDHREPDFVQDMRTDLPDGRSMASTFRGRTGGAEFVNDLPGHAWHSAATWEGDELLIESYVTMGTRKFHFRDRWYRRGADLVMQHRDGDLAGQIAWLVPAPDLAGEFAG